MKTKPCRCSQCRAFKRDTHAANRRFFKRMLSKWRRKAKPGQVKNMYWA